MQNIQAFIQENTVTCFEAFTISKESLEYLKFVEFAYFAKLKTYYLMTF